MDNTKKISELKAKLSEEIQKAKSDNSVILSLSNEISKLDETQIRFSVDAGIISRLGKELVGRHETAVSELVKNSYDADSTEVSLTFENAWQVGGTLIISDNGVGMTREQLINGFMRLSSADKIHNPISEKYNRTRAGRKGIGRFATQRLGNKLTVVTQTADSDSAIKITINWDDFATNIDLLFISNQIELLQKKKEEGTDLIIEGLREGWSDATIRRVFRYTSELLQPFPLSKKKKKEEENRIDPGFKSSYFRKDGNNITPITDEEEAIYKHALAEIEGYVMDNGQGCWALKSSMLNFRQEVFLIGKDKDIPESKFMHILGVHFKCYYFIYESSLLPSQTLTFIREIAKEKGGLRVYRNGFRVLPYGEKLNDWLGLDESSAKRVILSSHRNINFFGFVELTDSSGLLFDETSSREGLLENDAYHELVDFVQRSIISAVTKVAELRQRKGATSQKNWVKKEKTSSEKVDDAISKIKEAFSENGDEQGDNKSVSSNQSKQKFNEAFSELLEGREEEKQEKETLINEVNMLRVLAGLGLVIGEFVHEVKRFLPAFDADIVFIKDVVKKFSEALMRAERLDTNLKSFTAYTAYFDKAISQNILRELKPIDLRDVVNDFEIVIQNDIQRSQITFHKPIFEAFDLYTTPMHPSEWASIMFNFYTNSKKAIRRKQSQGEILIRCGEEVDKVFIEFSDNGDGISKENEDLIFNAFFTTSSAAGHLASDSDTLTGTGLGLKIVKDIIESYGGAVYVTTPEQNFTTTLRIEIPSNKIQDNGEI